MSPVRWPRWKHGCSEGRRPGQSLHPLKEMDHLEPKTTVAMFDKNIHTSFFPLSFWSDSIRVSLISAPPTCTHGQPGSAAGQVMNCKWRAHCYIVQVQGVHLVLSSSAFPVRHLLVWCEYRVVYMTTALGDRQGILHGEYSRTTIGINNYRDTVNHGVLNVIRLTLSPL